MLYFLTGITASGKSNLAHKIALENNMSILSVDSMAVYRGLDMLTAKPTDVMQAQVKYYGIDIAECDQNFSIIDYLNYLIDQEIPEKSFNEDILAVGGSGLYVKAITDRYEFMPTDPAIRSELEQLNYNQLIMFHELNEIPIPEIELNKRRLMRNIESYILEEGNSYLAYVHPYHNVLNRSNTDRWHFVADVWDLDGNFSIGKFTQEKFEQELENATLWRDYIDGKRQTPNLLLVGEKN